jgi:hypothetical protein
MGLDVIACRRVQGTAAPASGARAVPVSPVTAGPSPYRRATGLRRWATGRRGFTEPRIFADRRRLTEESVNPRSSAFIRGAITAPPQSVAFRGRCRRLRIRVLRVHPRRGSAERAQQPGSVGAADAQLRSVPKDGHVVAPEPGLERTRSRFTIVERGIGSSSPASVRSGIRTPLPPLAHVQHHVVPIRGAEEG